MMMIKAEMIHIIGTYSKKNIKTDSVLKRLLKENIAEIAIDAKGNVFYKDTKTNKKKKTNNETELNKILSSNQKEMIKRMDLIFNEEYQLTGAIKKSTFIAYKPITINYNKVKKFTVYPYVRIYEPDIVIAYLDIPLSHENIMGIAEDQARIINTKYKSLDSITNIEKYKKDEYDNNLADFSKIILRTVIKNKKKMDFTNRNEIIVECSEIDETNFNRLLYATTMKYSGNNQNNNFRNFDGFKLFCNDFNSLIYGELTDVVNIFPAIDGEIIFNIIMAHKVLIDVYGKKVSKEQKRNVKYNYGLIKSNQTFSKYTEQNEYIKYILELNNYNELIDKIIMLINDENEEFYMKNNYLLQIIAIILAIPTIYDYIIKPTLENYISNEITYPTNVCTVISLMIISVLIIWIINRKK